MAIEYIGEVTLKAPQHIEDKLAALAEKATQGHIQNVDVGDTFSYRCPINTNRRSLLTVAEEDGAPFGAFLNDTDAALYTALHNAAPALLAVVRAARRMTRYCDPLPVLHEGLREALAAIDAVEV